jgi:hypothetical protein
MTEEFIISTTEEGLQFIDNPELAFLKDLGEVETHRASHVEPDSLLLRLLFHWFRRKYGENGRAANWTRNWKCLWRVNMKPSGGPILSERWVDRKDALAAEVYYLKENVL